MNKQVEEMAVIGCVRNPQAHTAEECGKCDFKNGQCNSYRHAEALYNAGYRKLPENSVVLSMKEWECLHTDYAKALYNVRQNAVKDTTREICDEIIRKLETDWTDAIKAVKETAKSKGVEVE